MAANTWRPAGINNLWSNALNWSTLAVPTANDGNTATFDANALSGAVTVDVSAICNSIDFSAYNNTITMTNGITSSGSISLGSGMTITGVGNLSINATGTITSNGKTFPNSFLISASATVTMADDWTITGSFINNGNGAVLTGVFNFNVGINITISLNMAAGNATFIMTGTGTFSGAGNIANNITFDTSGTKTVSGTIFIAANKTMTATGKNIVWTGSILNVVTSYTFDLNGEIIYKITASSVTITLLSPMYVGNTATIGTSGNTFMNGSTIYYMGDIVTGGNNYFQNGTTLAVIAGTSTQTWSGNGWTTGNLTINATGMVIISATPTCVTGGGILSLNYLKGKLVMQSATLTIQSNATLTGMQYMNWLTITITAGVILTMDSFFNGLPNQNTTIQSSSSSNYTITFNSNKEIISRFVKVSNCTLSQPGRLLILTTKGNQGNNIGIRYFNQRANGFASNEDLSKSNFGNFGGWIKQY